MSSMYRGSRLRSTLNTSYIRFGHVSSMYRGSRLRSTSYRPRKNAKTLPRFSGRRQKHLYEISDKTRFFSMKHIPWKSKDHLNSRFFTKDYFLVGNFYHSKLGALILIVFDFQGIDRSSCSFPKHQELLIHRHPSVSQVVRDALWGSPGYHVMIPRNIPTGIHFCLYLQTIYETSISSIS